MERSRLKDSFRGTVRAVTEVSSLDLYIQRDMIEEAVLKGERVTDL